MVHDISEEITIAVANPLQQSYFITLNQKVSYIIKVQVKKNRIKINLKYGLLPINTQ